MSGTETLFKDDIDTFTDNKVIVKNGRSFDCDVFITCTGYTFGFPYLDKKLISIEVGTHKVKVNHREDYSRNFSITKCRSTNSSFHQATRTSP